MKEDPTDIERYYREMTDAELRAIIPKHLTPVGRQYYERESAYRGFISKPPLLDEQIIEIAKARAAGARAHAAAVRQRISAESARKKWDFQVPIEDIKARYHRMTDDELLRIAPRDLTPEALCCYIDEAKLRALPIEIPPPTTSPPAEDREVAELLRRASDLETLERITLPRGSSFREIASFLLFLKTESDRSRSTRHPILWLRRFHSPLEDRVFKTLLTTACKGLGTLLTIQDPTVHHSSEWGFASFRWLFVVFGFVLVVSNFVSIEMVVWVFFIGIVFLGAVMTYLYLMPGFGFTTISQDRPEDEVALIIHRIKRGIDTGASEPLVLHCAENNWQAVVAMAEALCAAVVVDATNMSDNMLWELETALRVRDPESIILAYGCREGERHEMPECVKRVGPTASETLLERSRRFFFHLDEASVEGRNSASQLRQLLAEAIVRGKMGSV